MDLSYAQKYQDFRAEVAAFLHQHGHLSPRGETRANRPDAQTLEWQRILIEKGYFARTIPTEYGGYGAPIDLLESVIISEEFARVGASPGILNQGTSMLVPTLLEIGSEAQRRDWVAPTIRGEIIWCQGYSEPGSGSDLASLRTHAHVEDGHFVINGQKIWTSSAHYADMMFALVRTEPDEPKHRGISYLLVPMDSPGIEVRPLKTMTGRAEFNEVFFTDVRVPVDQIVAGRGEGWRVANVTLKYERAKLGNPDQADAFLHAIQHMMEEETVDGRRVMDDAAFRDRLLRLQGRLLASRYHGLRLLAQQLQNEDPGVGSLLVKLNGTMLNHDLGALAVDVQGEIGTVYDGDKYQRDEEPWFLRYMYDLGIMIGGGTTQIQRNIVAERGLDMPREPKPAVDA